jgi:hypothetical protein
MVWSTSDTSYIYGAVYCTPIRQFHRISRGNSVLSSDFWQWLVVDFSRNWETRSLGVRLRAGWKPAVQIRRADWKPAVQLRGAGWKPAVQDTRSTGTLGSRRRAAGDSARVKPPPIAGGSGRPVNASTFLTHTRRSRHCCDAAFSNPIVVRSQGASALSHDAHDTAESDHHGNRGFNVWASMF